MANGSASRTASRPLNCICLHAARSLSLRYQHSHQCNQCMFCVKQMLLLLLLLLLPSAKAKQDLCIWRLDQETPSTCNCLGLPFVNFAWTCCSTVGLSHVSPLQGMLVMLKILDGACAVISTQYWSRLALFSF